MSFGDAFKTFPILKTKRLLLRKLLEEDAEEYHDSVTPVPVQFWGSIDRQSPEKAAMMIRVNNKAFEKKGYIRWGICIKPGRQLIGMVELFEFRNQFRAEIGYWLRVDYWGRGLMTEAIKEVVNFGWLAADLMRIEAFTAADNLRSIRMLEKAGFQREGLLRKHEKRNGVITDSVIMSVVR